MRTNPTVSFKAEIATRSTRLNLSKAVRDSLMTDTTVLVQRKRRLSIEIPPSIIETFQLRPKDPVEVILMLRNKVQNYGEGSRSR